MKPESIFADTNLFLRYLTNDVPEQASAFEQLMRRAESSEIALVTNSMVIAEIVWTLESYYRLGKDEIQGQILAILNTPGLNVADGDLILKAILWYAEKNVDFIDAYNAAWMSQQGITKVNTFDRRHFSRFESLTIIDFPL